MTHTHDTHDTQCTHDTHTWHTHDTHTHTHTHTHTWHTHISQVGQGSMEPPASYCPVPSRHQRWKRRRDRVTKNLVFRLAIYCLFMALLFCWILYFANFVRTSQSHACMLNFQCIFEKRLRIIFEPLFECFIFHMEQILHMSSHFAPVLFVLKKESGIKRVIANHKFQIHEIEANYLKLFKII